MRHTCDDGFHIWRYETIMGAPCRTCIFCGKMERLDDAEGDPERWME